MMKREECEAKILEKLKEIREIVKEYDDSNEGHLSMMISNHEDYISAWNGSSISGKLKTAINFTVIDGEVEHYGN